MSGDNAGQQQSTNNANNYHQQQQTQLEQAGLLPDLNGVDLAMSLSPKHHSTSHHHQQHQVQVVQQQQQQGAHTTPFSVTDILSPIEESYRKLELAVASSVQNNSPYVNCVGGRGLTGGGGGNTGSSSASSGSPPLHGGSTPGGSTPGPVSSGGPNGSLTSGNNNNNNSSLGGGSGGMSAMGNPYAMQLTSQYQYCAAELSPYHHAGPSVTGSGGGGGGGGDPMRSHPSVTSHHHHPWYAPAPPATNDPRFASEYIFMLMQFWPICDKQQVANVASAMYSIA